MSRRSETTARDSLDHRMETIQEVLVGRLSPLERRVELVRRRRGLVFGVVGGLFDGSLLEGKESDTGSEEQYEQDDSEFDTAENVKIEVDSPNSDEVRLANALAEKHSDAETIALADSDTIEVRGAPGGEFSLRISEALERELGESKESESVTSSTPSMGAAGTQGGFD